MPETGILLTQAEECLLVEFMLSKGAVLVPDIDHSSTSYPEVRTIEQFLRFRAVTRLFFVLHEDFKVVPLEIMATQKEGRSVYYIMQLAMEDQQSISFRLWSSPRMGSKRSTRDTSLFTRRSGIPRPGKTNHRQRLSRTSTHS